MCFMTSPTIFHIDVNSAYLSWEACYRVNVLGDSLDLRDIPSIVGGDISKRHGIVLAKSIPAKRYNIQTGESVTEALSKCPDLLIASPHYNLYERCSDAFRAILAEYAPVIEVYSVDECWCDMSGTLGLYGSPVVLANLVKDRIFHELGFSVNIGISSNKILAKMASDFQKPNRVHTLFPDEIPCKMWPLPVCDLFYVGRATEKKLKSMGITTIGELANTELPLLKSHFKKHGEVIWQYANGLDTVPVTNVVSPNKGYGNSTTIAFDIDSKEDAKMVLMALCENVCTRLRTDKVYGEVVSVEMTSYLFQSMSHQRKLLTPTNTTNEFYHHILELFDESWDKTPLRKLGVRAGKVTSDKMSQMNLFDGDKYSKNSNFDRTIDDIRKRFGKDSLMRASFINTPIHHMIGGISPDKNGKTNYVRGDDKCRKIFQ